MKLGEIDEEIERIANVMVHRRTRSRALKQLGESNFRVSRRGKKYKWTLSPQQNL